MKRLSFIFVCFLFFSFSVPASAACTSQFFNYRNMSWVTTNVVGRVGDYSTYQLGKYLYAGPGSSSSSSRVYACDSLEDLSPEYCGAAANNCSGTTPGSPNPLYQEPLSCDIGFSPNPSNTECVFTGCPVGSVQIGHSCSSLPELPLPNEDDEIICNAGGCFFEPSTCNPSSPDYQGTTNNTHFCNAPPLSCGANQTSGFADLGDGYVRVCVDQGNPDTNIADCPQGYVSINGICSQPDSQVKEQTNTVVEIGEDGTRKVTDTTTTTKNNKDGTTTTTTTTTTKTYDENDNLIGESSTQGEDEGKEGSSVSGGGSCAIEPSCSGADAVQCEILKEQWRLRCGGNPAAKKGFDFGDVAGQKIVAAQGEYDSAINTIKGQIASTLAFDLSGQAGGIPCNVIEIRGVSLDFSWCKFSDYLSWLGLVFIAIAYVRAFQIILG